MTEPARVLGGTLLRHGRHDWRWRDGVAEPRVRDLSPDRWNFRCRATPAGAKVEVLRGVAVETPALHWVLDGARCGRYVWGPSGDHTGPMTIRNDGSLGRAHVAAGTDSPELRGPIPSVVLVPVIEWDAWVAQHPAGATWDAEHELAILDRAHAFGWRPPPGYVSPAGWRAPADGT